MAAVSASDVNETGSTSTIDVDAENVIGNDSDNVNVEVNNASDADVTNDSDVGSGNASDVVSDNSSDANVTNGSDVGSGNASDVVSDNSSDANVTNGSDVGGSNASDVVNDNSSGVETSNVPDVGVGSASDNTSNVVATAVKTPVSVSAKTSTAKIFVKNSKFNIQIVDKNGKGIANKKVQIKFNNKVTNLTTNSKGHVYYKLTGKGNYKIYYTFKNEGYKTLSGSKSITIVPNSKSKLKGSNYKAYVGAKNPFKVTLTTGGVKLANKKVTFTIVGKKYVKTTNSKGQATLYIGLSKQGTYKIKYSFKGEANAKSASGSAKITVKKGMPTKVIRMNSVTFKHNVRTPLKFKYVDARGNPISSKTIVLEINGKYYAKGGTDDNGLVTIYVKKSKGSYKVTAYSYNTKVLKSSSNTFTINVRSDGAKYNGFWLFGADMKKVNLNTMAKNGVNQIFLNSYAIDLHGKNAVSEFALKAKSLGIKVHIWMETFNDGNWISPVTSSGKYKYTLFNSIIKEAKEYAAIKGVAGIHFDYLRFPGTAYKHKNGADAITYFTKTAANALHKQNPSLIVSAAVMPEPSAMVRYYGQDIPEMSKYLDWIIPMVYKGNYNQNSAWIKSVTSQFVKQSNGAKIITGIQGYSSDGNVKKLSASQLKKDASSAYNGGASGVIVFRYSLFNLIDFSKI